MKMKRKSKNIEELEFDDFYNEVVIEDIIEDIIEDDTADSWLFSNDGEPEDLYYSEKRNKFKNHEFVGGRLLQTNKKYSQLKEKQKILIAGWFFTECDKFYKKNNKFPKSKLENNSIVNLVYSRIEDKDIWIPFNEIKQYFSKKRGKIEKKVLKRLENVDSVK